MVYVDKVGGFLKLGFELKRVRVHIFPLFQDFQMTRHMWMILVPTTNNQL